MVIVRLLLCSYTLLNNLRHNSRTTTLNNTSTQFLLSLGMQNHLLTSTQNSKEQLLRHKTISGHSIEYQ